MNRPRKILPSPVSLVIACLLFLTAASFTPIGLLVWAMIVSGIFAYIFEGHHYQTAWLTVGVFLAVIMVLVPSSSTGSITPENQGISVLGLTIAAVSGLLAGIAFSHWRNRSSSQE
ncbi:MAG: hypothetical protein HUJ26_01895 [Planctomycetaceae bacterium]|nr:hypothetical protein [Planctomycetaceae bacterium]